ncbi:MAG: GNAT family N-acetyltransferase [Actinobacteria bacterium]|nr:GNAT family N-acetyltransferase [Actinomycetota bacterium]MBM4247382.1 GNAT family N-acetyltransferase [Deltaproteobacteria bacterium]
MAQLRLEVTNLAGEAIRALVARHLRGMHENSPPESVHALDLSELGNPSVTLWGAWDGGDLVGMGALAHIDSERGEIKSMRVVDGRLGRGFGRAILQHLVGEARRRGMTSLWLETGSTPAFTPALRLYESAGFVRCGPFADYVDDPFSVFMTMPL